MNKTLIYLTQHVTIDGSDHTYPTVFSPISVFVLFLYLFKLFSPSYEV